MLFHRNQSRHIIAHKFSAKLSESMGIQASAFSKPLQNGEEKIQMLSRITESSIRAETS